MRFKVTLHIMPIVNSDKPDDWKGFVVKALEQLPFVHKVEVEPEPEPEPEHIGGSGDQ